MSRRSTLMTWPVMAAIWFAWGIPTLDAQTRDAAEHGGTFDVMFLAADAPLWVRLRLAGDGVGVASVRERYARLLIQDVDTDGDGFAGETEAPQLSATGRPKPTGERLGERWTEFDTMDKDLRLSPAEYLAAIDARLGPAFTTRRKPPLLAQSVQLLPRLDGDGDRRISTVEIQEATHRLRPFDFDDDGTFSPAELQPFPQSMVDAAMVEEQGDDLQPFVLVDTETDLGELTTRILELYADEKGIPPERSGVSEFAFGELDGNGDGRLDASEAAGLVQRPRPAAEIDVDLARGRVSLRRPQSGSRQVEVLPTEMSRRLSLRLGAESIEFSAHDNRYAAADQINLLKIRFLQRDADRNGYMEPLEFAALEGMEASFEEVDGDTDGRVFLEELDRFTRLDSYLSQCAIEMEVETVEKPLFGILDANLDRRLTAREFAAGSERLGEFDHNGDGTLDAQELDVLRRFRVKFAFVVPPAVRPERNMQMAANRRMPIVNQTAPSGPEWFQKMDRNQDGDLMWREFLGPQTAFDTLDADGSGWIDEDEAAAAGG